MKKYWIKIAGCAATAVVIFLVILGMVDLHTDGVLVRDGCYVIRPDEMKTYRMDVYGNSGIVGTWVNLVRDVDGASQIFAIHYTGEDQYMIEYGDQGYCIAVASDKETVVMQDYDKLVNIGEQYNQDAGNFDDIMRGFTDKAVELKQATEEVAKLIRGMSSTINENSDGIAAVSNNTVGLTEGISQIKEEMSQTESVSERLENTVGRFTRI